MNERLKLCFDESPTEIGWYATLHTWDPMEGFFPDAHYWDGKEWLDRGRASISYWPTVFPSKEEAKNYADEHDPDMK